MRSYDREHSLELINAGVDYQIRETFESAVNFGAAALVELGVPADEAERIAAEIRRRDAERFEIEMAGGAARGRGIDAQQHASPKPTPFTTPRREGPGVERRDGGSDQEPGPGQPRRLGTTPSRMKSRKASP